MRQNLKHRMSAVLVALVLTLGVSASVSITQQPSDNARAGDPGGSNGGGGGSRS